MLSAMRIPPRIASIGAIGAIASTLLIGGPALAAASPAARPAAVSSVTASPAGVAAVGDICYSRLPSQAHHTLALIQSGGPFPYRQDGAVFQNRERVLPSQPSSYYHEYTVITPGSTTRGARRIVTGLKTDEDYYTADHYATFALVDYTC